LDRKSKLELWKRNLILVACFYCMLLYFIYVGMLAMPAFCETYLWSGSQADCDMTHDT
jgi:hypothetical protein